MKANKNKKFITKIIIAAVLLAILTGLSAFAFFDGIITTDAETDSQMIVSPTEDFIVMTVGEKVSIAEKYEIAYKKLYDYTLRYEETDFFEVVEYDTFRLTNEAINSGDVNYSEYIRRAGNNIDEKNPEAVFIDNELYLHAAESGRYTYKLCLCFAEKEFEFLIFEVVVKDYDYSDYIKISSLYEMNDPHGKYILNNDMSFHANTVYENFSGVLANPYGYTVSIPAGKVLFKTLTESAIIDGVKTNCLLPELSIDFMTEQVHPLMYVLIPDVISLYLQAAGIAHTNNGVIMNCNVKGNLTGTTAGGITIDNNGILYGNAVDVTIYALNAAALSYTNDIDLGIVRNNNVVIDYAFIQNNSDYRFKQKLVTNTIYYFSFLNVNNIFSVHNVLVEYTEVFKDN